MLGPELCSPGSQSTPQRSCPAPTSDPDGESEGGSDGRGDRCVGLGRPRGHTEDGPGSETVVVDGRFDEADSGFTTPMLQQAVPPCRGGVLECRGDTDQERRRRSRTLRGNPDHGGHVSVGTIRTIAQPSPRDLGQSGEEHDRARIDDLTEQMCEFADRSEPLSDDSRSRPWEPLIPVPEHRLVSPHDRQVAGKGRLAPRLSRVDVPADEPPEGHTPDAHPRLPRPGCGTPAAGRVASRMGTPR